MFDWFDEDCEGCCGVFLICVVEGVFDEVGDCEVEVGGGGDDDCVFVICFGE